MAKDIRVTAIYDGREYPFYRTNRGRFDFHNAGYTTEQLAAGDFSAMMAFVFFQLRDCAKRAGKPLEYSFDEFIDNSGDDVLQPLIDLVNAENTEKQKEKEKLRKVFEGNQQPEIVKAPEEKI